MNKLTLILIFCVYAVTALAQPKVNSPYSRFGLGDFFDQNLISVSSIAGSATAFTDPYQMNVRNPASLAHLRFTSFDIGANAKLTQLKEGDLTKSVWSGNISYLSLGFPIFNPLNEILDRKTRVFHWGMGFSLIPYTNVGYEISNTEDFAPVGEVERYYKGEGGSYRFMWGNGFKYKHLSAGINLGYLFGKLQYDRDINFADSRAYVDQFTDEITIRGFQWNAGLLYDIYLDKHLLKQEITPQKRITIGLYGNNQTKLTTYSNTLYFKSFGVNNISVIDTVAFNRDLERSGTLPGEFSIGITYRDGLKWRAGISYSMQGWSNYENEAKKELLNDTYRLSVGVGYRPDINAFENFYKTVEYRAGFFIGTDPRSVDQNQLRQFGITLGAGIPFYVQRKISFINLGLEIGQLGYSDALTNTYAKFSFGFTLNDNEWFVKNKIY